MTSITSLCTQESLGGNSLTSMLATISPANTHLDETLATLRYACQARTIVNRARVNENPHDRLIRELKSEVQRLKALKQDYERNSLLNTSLTLNLSNNEELDELRSKLTHAEEKLLAAESHWKKRFMESTEMQMKELAESEKRREELESKVRVMKTVDTNVDLSLYKTNFLEELKDVLTQEEHDEQEAIDRILEWCRQNHLECKFTSSAITILDNVNSKQTFFSLKDVIKMNAYDNVGEFLNSLTWTEIRNIQKLSKNEIVNSLNQIYQVLNNLQPLDNDNNLNLLFARVNKSLQAFEAALLHNFTKTNGQKTVSFNL